MIHQMGLYGKYFEIIKDGKKKVEVRLNDEKRRKINVGDTIEFINASDLNEILKVQVVELRKFVTFKDMYESIPFKDFGCEGWTIKEMLEKTYEIYTLEQEKEWGTLAITISC
ncbi:ASCH domain-containing protein [Alkaliphilus peptidifermentans]|uniref:ASC-1 homology (ASCH) domain-containing protein n=1 Tax=Alkaliphilus peptidifermentans DSM 18978 TaxID=1120976 RepID=A0A1G5LFS6_9FIRM|nr:ASCH domain-containing protein [Alkaliphilus peptidifermentans]SCZ11785.1 ASC-1 homology (ASCH) domain-containing protein [Alkaliphilus peptidifermentans DSM 18978]